MSKKIKKANANPTIALFIGGVTHAIQDVQFQGCLDAAEKNNINLICFLTRWYEFSTSFEDQYNMLFRLGNHQEIDGIIVWPSTILTNKKKDEIVDFINKYNNIPAILGNIEIEGFPCVIDNSYHDMKQGITHLISDHGFKKIAFIRGPENHQPANQRYQAYLDTLHEFNIPVNGKLITPPTDWNDGDKSLDLLFTERKLRIKIDIEAIVACSQSLLVGLMNSIKKQRIKVPDDIALLGFDDSDEIRAMYPPITTSYSAHYEMGYKTVELLLAKLKGQKIPRSLKVNGELLLRKSCGCTSLGTKTVDTITLKLNENKKNAEVLYDNFNKLLLEVNTIVINIDEAKQWTINFINSFVDEIENNNKNTFTNEIIYFFNMHYSLYKPVDKFKRFIFSIQNIFLFCIGKDPHLSLKTLNIFQRIWLSFDENKDILLYKRMSKQKQLAKTLNILERILISTFKKQSMFTILQENLSALNIKTCYIYTFNKPIEFNKISKCQQISLEFAIENGNRLILDSKNNSLINMGEIIDHLISKINNDTYLLLPLLFGKELIGYIIFYFDPNESIVFETLCDIIASSLKGSNTMQDQLQIKEELIRSNKDLEQFAYVASHDLQEPLRMVSSYLQLLERRFKDNLDDDLKEFIGFATEGSLRMNNLINGLLEYSRINSKINTFTTFDTSELVKEVLLDLSILIKEKKAEIIYDKLPEITGDKSQLKRLFQNLISNALKFNEQKHPEVHINVKQNPKNWKLSFTDNGIGIDPKYFNKIFLIFQRLNQREQFEGTGIGLAICKKIVEGHGGLISVESALGKGTTFHFTIIKPI